MNTSDYSKTGNEVTFPADVQLVSTTDLQSYVTYANTAFLSVSGYALDELVGLPHNVIHHPDMPKTAFRDMWQKLKEGKAWRGIVKNRCKNGDFYWVDAYVTPIYEDKNIVGYQSVRVKPNAEDKSRAEKIYKQLHERERLNKKITFSWHIYSGTDLSSIADFHLKH